MTRLQPKHGAKFQTHRRRTGYGDGGSQSNQKWTRLALIFVLFALVLVVPACLGCNIDTRAPYATFDQGIHNQPGSYFGYTVLQYYSNIYGSFRFLVGAPQASGTPGYGPTADKPGGLFTCEVVTDEQFECEPVLLANPSGTTSASLEANEIIDYLDNGWMGATLVRQSNVLAGNITVCGHRVGNDFVINQPGANLTYEEVDRYAQGLCYTLNPNTLTLTSVTRFNPCAERDAWKEGVSENDKLRWQGWCQFGLSASYTAETDTTVSQSLVVGAAGAFNWTGTTYTQDLIGTETSTPGMVAGNLSDWNPDYSYDGFYQYIGYSISVGSFLSNSTQQGATGAPRAAGLVGKVYIYDLKAFNVYQELQGEMMNTYFGGAVEAIDINNDGLSDLLVGAPLYSTDQDEGRVYVYMNDGGGNSPLQLRQTLDGSSTPMSRFGQVIVTMGDLNSDQYPDVAIGAPYEGGGVVYIYTGTANGLDEAISQRIDGRDTDPTVASFGSAIARGEDFDSNSYPDLVVGAYANDTVFVYKTRPLLDLEVELTVTPDPMDPENPTCVDAMGNACLNITICYNYYGPSPGALPRTIEVIYDLRLDSVKTGEGLKPRFLMQIDGEMVMQYNTTQTINFNEDTCFNYIAYLEEAATDFLTPMPVDLTYILMDYPVEPEARGDRPLRFPGRLAPVMKSYQCAAVLKNEDVNFVRDCGLNAICETDLQLEADIEIEGNPAGIIVGGPSKIYINNLVKNVGEEAHQAVLIIDHPLDVRYEGIEINELSCINLDGSPKEECDSEKTLVLCEPRNLETRARVTCSLGNPMKSYTASQLRLRFDIGGVIWKQDRSVEIVVTANTSSVETLETLANNQFTASYDLLIEADIGIYGSASPESVYYSSNSSGYVDEIAAQASLAAAVQMALTDPTSQEFNDSHIGAPFNLSYRLTNGGRGRLPFSSYLTINIPWRTLSGDWLVYFKKIQVSSSTGTQSGCNVEEIMKLQNDRIYDIYVTKTDLLPSPAEEIERIYEGLEGAQYLGCGKAKCVSLRCRIDTMQDRDLLEVKIDALQWEYTLVTRALGYVELLTEANIIPRDSNVVFQQGEDVNPDTIQLIVKFFTDVEGAGKVPIWVIIVSIIGGILLLILLILLMWKCGFFKRSTREDWEKEVDGQAAPMPIKPPMSPHGELDGSDLPMMKGPASS